MAGHTWLSPNERQVLLDALVAGTAWADADDLVVGTDPSQVDATFCATMETILTNEAAVILRERLPGTASRLDTYRHLVTPTFTSITPATGDAAGGETKVIVGTGFDDPAVTIGGHAQTRVSWNPTTIVIKTVAHAAEADEHLIITNHSTLSVEANDAYATIAAATPTFTSITPASGLRGQVCHIVGTNFKEGVTVQFGTTYALVTAWSATTIQCIAPPGSGTVALIITNKGAGAGTEHADAAAAFTYSS